MPAPTSPHQDSDGLSITFIGANGTVQRVRFEPRGFDEGHWRIVEERVGRTWRRILREPVTAVDYERTIDEDPGLFEPTLGRR